MTYTADMDTACAALREGRLDDIDPATFPALIAHLRKYDPAAYIAAAARLIGDDD